MWTVLKGIRVLDLSRVFAGPAATQILGDLGADVIKVEEPGRGDEARHFGITRDMQERHERRSPSFLALNRNKRSIAIDLASAGRTSRRAADGQGLRRRRPQLPARRDDEVRARLRATCATVRPDIIFCEFYSYGPTGPLSHIGANDLALQAHSGMMSITGEPDRPPVRCGTSIVDLHASLALVTAILAALFHRERTGEGQAVETSLLRSSAHLMNYFYGEYWALGVDPRAHGHGEPPVGAEPGVPRCGRRRRHHRALATTCGGGRPPRSIRRSTGPNGARPSTGSGIATQIIEAISAVTRTMTQRRADRAVWARPRSTSRR